MPNYLQPIRANFAKAWRELEKALSTLEAPEGPGRPSMSLIIKDDMAKILKEKAVLIIQTQNIKVVNVTNRINLALRAFDRAEEALRRYNDLMMRNCGQKKTRKEDKGA